MLKLQLEDSRRLTGPNLFSKLPGAIIDVSIQGATAQGITAQEVVQCWEKHARGWLQAVGWANEKTYSRIYHGGASLVISAPIDALYAATEVNEVAWAACCNELGATRQSLNVAGETQRLKTEIGEESNPRLLALRDAVARHGKRFLVDDDVVSVGYGADSQSWSVDAIPDPATVDWPAIGSIPLALVTGTNGKSTSVRLAAEVFKAAGLTCGVTSTDYIRVGEQIIDSGDYSGPGGARTLLRDARAEAALLEVARGGMLRRGLGVTEADAALITNVAADHLGEYGINTVAELIQAKFVVAGALRPEQPLILNADDAGIVAHASTLVQRIIWFSARADNPVLQEHCAGQEEGFVVQDGVITICQGDIKTPLLPLAEIPITLGGAAQHNVMNALGVAALCHALNIDHADIRNGLRAFSGDAQANPGRGNYFEKQKKKILIDFAHNEHGLRAVANTLANLPAQRRLIMLGQAGDRSDELIGDLVAAALSGEPDHLVITDLPGYDRGRQPGEVVQLIHQVALDGGLEETQISLAKDPLDGTRQALDWAEEGDLLLLLALTQRDEVLALIQQLDD